jgi:hypothetical protein
VFDTVPKVRVWWAPDEREGAIMPTPYEEQDGSETEDSERPDEPRPFPVIDREQARKGFCE